MSVSPATRALSTKIAKTPPKKPLGGVDELVMSSVKVSVMVLVEPFDSVTEL